jgi:hypothetical protein
MTISELDLIISPHCVERFHERFRPALDEIRARRELEMLLLHGEISGEPPEWLAEKMLQDADAYLIIGADLVMPLASRGPLGERFVAKTCISRGGISEPARRRRNERGRRRRAARRARRRR